ncbi:NACHT domain-containing protein [Neptuniibacter pectenicola]|uniref:NACHT domain-containing protein n=1 Tax=Neptuniibacter pectenicola TaxID=1806669 RepID=A0ABU9TQE5_9GAMM
MSENDTELQNLLTKAVTSETGKIVTNFFFGKLEGISHSFAKNREIQDALSVLNTSENTKNQLVEKFHDKYLTTRTILKPGINQDILDIYHPLSIKDELSGNIQQIDSKTPLNTNKITCIIGKAGQGKTTLLKRLLLTSMERGSRFPIFISLRDVNWESASTLSIVKTVLNHMSIEVSEETCSFLLQSERALIFWDGFDEIPDQHRRLAVHIIEESWNRYHCPSIVTTRPETEITIHGGSIRNKTLIDLEPNDVTALIKNTVSDDDDYRHILLDTLRSNTDIAGILLTPILVDIFIYTYRSLRVEPKSEADFYSQIFACIASQHDRLKILDRQTQSGLSIDELEQAFHLASFLLTKENINTFSDRVLRKAFSEACSKLQLQDTLARSHSDVINISNLIIPDGFGCYSYIHKSIMEFYAAAFIASSSEDTQKLFYQKVHNHFSKFARTLQFLFEIDTASFLNFFAKPILDEFKLEKKSPMDVAIALSGVNKMRFITSPIEQSVSAFESSEAQKISHLAQSIDEDAVSFLRFSICSTLSNLDCDEVEHLADANFYDFETEALSENIVTIPTALLCKHLESEDHSIFDEAKSVTSGLIDQISELIKKSEQKESDVEELMDIL